MGVHCGSAVVQYGGEEGIVMTLHAGDVVVIPAGVAHKKLFSALDFAVVGAYPSGQRWDMNYGNPEERPQADWNNARVPMPAYDPVLTEGGLVSIWEG